MYFNELELGMTVDIAPAKIERDKMLDFAKLYDNIPLHTDEEYALKRNKSHVNEIYRERRLALLHHVVAVICIEIRLCERRKHR